MVLYNNVVIAGDRGYKGVKWQWKNTIKSFVKKVIFCTHFVEKEKSKQW